MKKLLVAFMLVAATALSGCATLAKIAPVLADAVIALQDASQYLDQVDAGVRAAMAIAPFPEFEKRWAEGMSKARASLRVAAAATRGAEDLSREDADRAFDEFRRAYDELQQLLAQMPAPARASAGAAVTAPAPPLAIAGPVSR